MKTIHFRLLPVAASARRAAPSLGPCAALRTFACAVAFHVGWVSSAVAGLEPNVPHHFIAAPGDREVRLSWAEPDRARSYTVKTGAAATGPFSVLATGLTVRAFTHTNLTNGRAYFYVVAAVNEHGESEDSAALSATPSAPVLDVLPAGAKVERLAGGFAFVEGPVWVPRDGGYLIFSDINGNRLIRWSPRTGATTFRTPSGQANGNTLDAEGRLLTCEHANRRVSRTDLNGTLSALVDRFNGRTFNAPNDVVVKSDGTVWFTDPNYGAGQTQLGRYVFRCQPTNGNATVTFLVTNFDQPNGLCFSPDESRLYIADSGGPHHIRVFDVLPDNTLSTGRVFAVLSTGVPDGMRTDAAGRLFSSGGGGLHIFGTNGTLLARLPVNETPANLCFGGTSNQMLFITAQTALYGITRMPDLVVTAVRRTPLNPRRGQGIVFSATVKNQGTGPTVAGTPMRLAFTIGTETNVVWSDDFSGTLAPDASVTLTCNAGRFGPAWTATNSGNFTMRAVVDDLDQFAESNETNNVLTAVLNIPNAPDTDGDGHDDSIENFAGTDPRDAASVLRVLSVASTGTNAIAITWASVTGKVYRVVCKARLADLLWSDVSPGITATETNTAWIGPLPSEASQLYFKVRVGP